MVDKAKPIKISITNGVTGQPVILKNRTTNEAINTTIESTGKLTVDLQNFASGFEDGDIIDISVSGEVMGSTTLTVSGDAPQSVTLSTSAITSGLSRGVR